jgi:hypothetical protein
LGERKIMALSKTLYHCDTDNMDFTDGAEQDNIVILTGKPKDDLVEGEDYGEGICPNCGKKGTEIGTHEWADEAVNE